MAVHIVPYPDVNMQIVKQVLDCRQTLITNGSYGPFRVLMSVQHASFLGESYFKELVAKNDMTLADRILQIDGVKEIVLRKSATTIAVECSHVSP